MPLTSPMIARAEEVVRGAEQTISRRAPRISETTAQRLYKRAGALWIAASQQDTCLATQNCVAAIRDS